MQSHFATWKYEAIKVPASSTKLNESNLRGVNKLSIHYSSTRLRGFGLYNLDLLPTPSSDAVVKLHSFSLHLVVAQHGLTKLNREL